MLRFFKPQIAMLLNRRDQVLRERAAANPSQDPAADESFEVTSQVPIDVDQQLIEVMRELNRRSAVTELPAGTSLYSGSSPLHA